MAAFADKVWTLVLPQCVRPLNRCASVLDTLKTLAVPYCVATAARDSYRELRDKGLINVTTSPEKQRRAQSIVRTKLIGCAPIAGSYIQDALKLIPGYAD